MTKESRQEEMKTALATLIDRKIKDAETILATLMSSSLREAIEEFIELCGSEAFTKSYGVFDSWFINYNIYSHRVEVNAFCESDDDEILFAPMSDDEYVYTDPDNMKINRVRKIKHPINKEGKEVLDITITTTFELSMSDFNTLMSIGKIGYDDPPTYEARLVSYC